MIVLPELPRLHTLLICVRRYDHSSSWLAHDLQMQRTLLEEYENHAPALRLVAFTAEFEWEKRADGLWYTTEDVEAEYCMYSSEEEWSSEEETDEWGNIDSD